MSMAAMHKQRQEPDTFGPGQIFPPLLKGIKRSHCETDYMTLFMTLLDTCGRVCIFLFEFFH